MPRKLKPFGQGDSSYDWGYTLPVLVGHLESLASTEGDRVANWRGPIGERQELVDAALEKLQAAVEYEDQD